MVLKLRTFGFSAALMRTTFQSSQLFIFIENSTSHTELNWPDLSRAIQMIMRHALLALTLTATFATAFAQSYPPAPFFDTLSTLCGARFEGKSVFPFDDAPGNAFAHKKLVANIVTCSADEIRVPFIVGEDKSRTWIIKRTQAGLELLHDHRHPDAEGRAAGTFEGD